MLMPRAIDAGAFADDDAIIIRRCALHAHDAAASASAFFAAMMPISQRRRCHYFREAKSVTLLPR